MQSTRILAIRHGETDWNVQGRIQGQLDIALNDHGRSQAERLACALAAGDEALHSIYSSDLVRAHDTARAVSAATGAPLHTHTGLRERHFGSFQGKTFGEIETAWPQEAQRWRQRDPQWQPPGGESLTQMQQRVHSALHELAARHLGQQIVLLTHGGVLDMLYRSATGMDLQAPRTWLVANTAVNRLLWNPQAFVLVAWADTTHLDAQARDEDGA